MNSRQLESLKLNVETFSLHVACSYLDWEWKRVSEADLIHA